MDVGVWLRSLGLSHYEAAFADNSIDADILPDLSDSDLKELGLRFRCELSRWRDSRYMDPGWIGRGGANGSGRRLQGAAIHRRR